MSHTPGNSKNMLEICREFELDVFPDLLEACKESLEYLRECGIDELTAPESELMCKLESAIQKAEGGKV